MNTTQQPLSDATDALVNRLFLSTLAALEIASVHIGNRLGFYRELADGGEATSAQLAARTGTAERYVREWLEQQAVAGFLTVEDATAEAAARRYGLLAAHRSVFIDRDDLNHLVPLTTLAVGALRPMDALLDAYRSGGGVPYEAYGADMREGIGAANRPTFVNRLAGWLGSVREVDVRLRAQPPARVADVACGSAWSSIAIARAYPDVTVDAIDLDHASIETARANVIAAGLTDRVRPAVNDASDPALGGRYDLVTIFEALHDMTHPVAALRAARGMLVEGGIVVIGDERVAERFTAPGDEIERLNYGWSVLHCLAVGMLDQDPAGTGTVIRPDTVRRYAAEAGFSRVDVLSIEDDFWRFYRLVP
ncbi:MAG: class I SAM-dependent methyltransferase [Candidatus Dormibacteraeota bacterium]|nr:class I SAM-dependent methyltransferase [Candidatus Dormibacteraeota bacterium]